MDWMLEYLITNGMYCASFYMHFKKRVLCSQFIPVNKLKTGIYGKNPSPRKFLYNFFFFYSPQSIIVLNTEIYQVNFQFINGNALIRNSVFIRSNHFRRCFVKMVFLKFNKNFSKSSVLEPLFNKVADLQTCNFTKNRLQHLCFPVKFMK